MYEPDTGRVLEVSSTEPGVQFYSGNFLDGTQRGQGRLGVRRARRAGAGAAAFSGLAQSRRTFPAVILKPGQTYHNTIVYRFSAR